MLSALPLILAYPEPGDLARAITGGSLRWEGLQQIQKEGLSRGEVPITPWSGWYWPLSDGGLAARLIDLSMSDHPRAESQKRWSETRERILSRLGIGKMEELSPAEKYDLLVGDKKFTLSRSMIRLADQQVERDRIAIWKGFCTGWANAAMQMARPVRAVEALSADAKTRVRFTPDDIKALAALLWTTGSFAFRSAGTLCSEDPVRREPGSERELNPICRDTNPATLHLTLVNQVGGARSSFLIDTDPGAEVWNQPVVSYSYVTYHPITEVEGPIEISRVRLKEWANDPRREYRATGAQSVIGVKTSLTFVYETLPGALAGGGSTPDELRTAEYFYELELDAFGKIVGGEWTTSLHPDLIWVASPGAFPISWGDRALSQNRDEAEWKKGGALPPSWPSAALQSSERAQPLGRVVQKLFEWAR